MAGWNSIPEDSVAKHRFGRLTALTRERHGKRFIWLCRCDCGATTRVEQSNLIAGSSTSCGCFRREQSRKQLLTHGETGTPEWYAWRGLRGRCLYPKHISYPYYGGRGITVCARWANSFEHFLTDMGRKPSAKHTIERVDNDGNYEPSNCRWATRHEQALNTRRRHPGLVPGRA